MKKREAINDIRRWRSENQKFNFKHGRLQDDGEFLISVYSDILMNELIERIRTAPASMPVSHILAELHDEYDKVLADSDDDHIITHRFAGLMEMLTADLQRRWKGK